MSNTHEYFPNSVPNSNTLLFLSLHSSVLPELDFSNLDDYSPSRQRREGECHCKLRKHF